MTITISNEIRIENPTKEVWQYVKRNLIFENPEYHKKLQMGFWIGDTPRLLYLYEKIKDDLIIPFGMINYVRSLHGDIKYDFPKSSNLEFNCKIVAKDYQEEPIERMVNSDNGILIADCGTGKTVMGLELVARLKKPTLWIAHTKDLVYQARKEANQFYDIPKHQIGTITNGKVDIGTHITFATIQTLSKINLDKYADLFDVVIVDECHRVGGTATTMTMYYNVLNKLRASRKFGLTATPKKSNGLDMSMYSLLGTKKFIVNLDEHNDNTTVPVKVKLCASDLKPDIKDITKADMTIDYNKMLKWISVSPERNNFIKNEINKFEGPLVVLSERIEHLENLKKLVPNGSAMITGTTPKAEREQTIDDFKDGKIKVLFASYQLLSEGFNYKNLRGIILASPIKNERLIQQATGRVARKAPNKDHGEVIDIVDDLGIFYGMLNKRKIVYRRLGYELS